jgi:hypothetical protein
VAGAVYEELGMVEVVLRDALDCQLCLFHRRRMRGNGQWWAEASDALGSGTGAGTCGSPSR